jgi:hypothetical protein
LTLTMAAETEEDELRLVEEEARKEWAEVINE